MIVRSTSRVLASLALGAAVVVAGSPAFAADGTQYTSDTAQEPGPRAHCVSVHKVGKACFESYGEWFWIIDTEAQGRGVAVRWDYTGPRGQQRHGTIIDKLGARAGWTNLNKSFAENGEIRFQVCDMSGLRVTDKCCGYRTVVT